MRRERVARRTSYCNPQEVELKKRAEEREKSRREEENCDRNVGVWTAKILRHIRQIGGHMDEPPNVQLAFERLRMEEAYYDGAGKVNGANRREEPRDN